MSRTSPQSAPREAHVAPLKLSPKEIEDYSLEKVVMACRAGSWVGAEYEHAISMDLKRQHGIPVDTPHRCLVPPQVIAAGAMRRDLSAASASAGGYLVDTEVQGVLDALRPISVAGRLGVQTPPPLKANAVWARQGTAATFGWLPSETSQAVETQTFNLGQVAASPKHGVIYTERSWLMGLQASKLSDIMLARELARSLSTGVETALFNGTGASGQPLGVLNTAGIYTFTGASLSWANALVPQGQILGANALNGGGSVAYVTTPAVAQVLANRQGFSTNAPLWLGSVEEGQLAGCLALSTTLIPAATLLAGDWSRAVLVEWGAGMMIEVNPYANFPAGIVGYRASIMCDVVLESVSAFSVATSVS